jgi:MOSC domain-containing protein YiiM
MELRLVSVNVGTPKQIGTRNGAPLMSAIGKQPVSTPVISVYALGLEGDQQANLLVHGGFDKAVYAYPVDHWGWWEREQGLSCGPASFGENLSVEGAEEDQVRIGDRFGWGETVLEVSQPRSPCHKLQTWHARDNISAVMTQAGRCGWYLRVVSEGVAPTRDTVLTLVDSCGGPTVREAFLAAFDRALSTGAKAKWANTPSLAQAWRNRFL